MDSEFNLQGKPENSQQPVDEKQVPNDLQSSGHGEDVNQLHEWARQEHLEWFRYNTDPYYPTCYEYYGQERPSYNLHQDRYWPTNFQSYDQEPSTTGNLDPNVSQGMEWEPEESPVVESESEDDDDEDQIPNGILALWEMLRGDGEVDVAADENNNWVQVT